MSALFPRVLNMSAAGSVVILVILLARLPLRKAPKKWSYLLWSAAGFRLSCPVSIRAAFSVFRLPPVRPVVTGIPAGPMTYLPLEPGLTARFPAQFPQITAAPELPEAVRTALPAASSAAMHSGFPQTVLSVTAGIWCAGALLLLLCGAVSYGKVRRRVETAIRLRDNIYQSDAIRSPFILGLVRPRVYIPFGLAPEPLRHVLAHERCHIRRRDYLVKAFAFLLLSVHWFNPLCWLAFRLMERDMEMSCDESVLSGQEHIRRAYSLTLLSFATERRFSAAGPLAFGETGVRRRVRNALAWRRPPVVVTLFSAALCAAVLMACAVNPDSASADKGYPDMAGVPAPDLPPPVREAEVHRVNGEPYTIPLRRYDGDGWYVYIPETAWNQTRDGYSGLWRWESAYRTGSALTVEYVTEPPENATGRFVPSDGANGGGWYIFTQAVSVMLDPYTSMHMEPEILPVMAESFTVDSRFTAREDASDSAAVRRALSEINPDRARLSLLSGGESPVNAQRSYAANLAICAGEYLNDLREMVWIPLEADDGRETLARYRQQGALSIALTADGWTLVACDRLACLSSQDGETFFTVQPGEEIPATPYAALRAWYQEASTADAAKRKPGGSL